MLWMETLPTHRSMSRLITTLDCGWLAQQGLGLLELCELGKEG